MGEGSSKPGDLALGDIRTDRPFVVRMWTWRKILPFRRFHPVGCGSIFANKGKYFAGLSQWGDFRWARFQ